MKKFLFADNSVKEKQGVITQPPNPQQSNQLIDALGKAMSQAFTEEIFLFILVGVAIWLRDFFKKRIKEKNILKQFGKKNIHTKINEILNDILSNCQASRVVLGLFHNGGESLCGVHYLKVSITNQACKKNVLPIQFKDIPIGRLAEEIDILSLSSEKTLWIYQLTVEDENCRKYLNENGIEAIALRIIYKKNFPIGIISIQYLNDASLLEKSCNYYVEDHIKELETILNA